MNKKNFVNKVVLPGALAIVAAVVPFVLFHLNNLAKMEDSLSFVSL